MTAADAPSGHEFCVFDFPGCKGCPKALHVVRMVGSSEDPMKSGALRAWVAAASRFPNTSPSAPIRDGQSMEEFIHKENLALFKKRLAESHTDAEREVLLKLLANEKAKELLPEK